MTRGLFEQIIFIYRTDELRCSSMGRRRSSSHV